MVAAGCGSNLLQLAMMQAACNLAFCDVCGVIVKRKVEIEPKARNNLDIIMLTSEIIKLTNII